MAWTKEQLDAINMRGNNILVSAGAGSGKTAVLTERITSIVKEGVPITSLLVLTFTNAAAEEMRERVRKKLSEEKDNKYCSEALKYIDSAKITTFDGYSLYLVKKYFYVLGIAPDIKIANGYYLYVKANEILDEILDKLYENNDRNLCIYFDNFKDKNDVNLKNSIFNMYNKLTLRLDLYDYLDRYDDIYSDDSINSFIDRYVVLIKEKIEFLSMSLSELENLLDENNIKLIEEIEDNLLVISKLNNYSDIFNYINNFKLNNNIKNGNDDTAKARKQVMAIVSSIKEYLLFSDNDSMKENILSNRNYSNLFIRIIKELDYMLNKFKKDNNYYDFIDIAKMAISLVDNNYDVRDEIANNIYEILIDEYQDTSDIQEAFIAKIARNNLYMVGDVKQSIYRFRNANPYIFKEKYNLYKNNDGGIKIDLNKNFRSRSEVLNNINTIFNRAMTDNIGDANYVKEHQMNYGLIDYDSNKDKNYEYNMDLVLYDIDSINGEEFDYSSAEAEAFFIAEDINKLVKKGIKIYDKDEKTFRKIRYSDICIIMDRGSNFSLYKEILEYKGIPTAINADSKLNESKIMPIVSNLINLVVSEAKGIYDERYYHSVYSIGRSFLYEIDDNELFRLVSEAKNSRVRVDCGFTNIAYELSKKIYNYSPKEVYLNILRDYMVSEKLFKVGNVNESLVVLEYIMDFIDNINSIGESLIDINEYILDLLNNDNDMKYQISVKNAPGVKLMNIHKSKGLEFPICYFSGLATKFNQGDYKNSVGYLSESGFYYVPNEGISIVKEVGLRDLRIKDISEKVRLLYVALTRAREKMILIHPNEFYVPKNYQGINKMGDILALALDDIDDYIVEKNDIGLTRDYKFKISKRNIKYNDKPNYVLNNYLGNIIEKNRISKEVIEVLSDEEEENLDYGNHLHEIMEMINFNNPDISYLDKEEYDIISNVLGNELFKNIKNGKTYHEHEFYANMDSKVYHGIIDLLVIYDDHVDIIDYKLKNIDHKEYDRQLGIYKKYVESQIKLPIKCYLLSLLENKYREVL